MRGPTRMLPALGVLLFLPLLISVSVAAQTGSTSVSYVLEQGDFSTTLVPLQDSQSVTDFYNYSNFQSNTGLEVNGRSQIFLYENTNTGNVSLVVVHGLADGGAGDVSFSFDGLPDGTQFQVQDDADDTWTINPPTAQIDWTWQAGFNDGAALGPLSRTFELTITPQFNSGIDEWAALSGNVNNPESRLLPNLNEQITIRARVGTPPTAEFSFNPRQPGIGTSVTFDASGSEAADDQEIASYEWDFDGDGAFDVSTDSPTIDHSFNQTGTFRVALRITDDRGVSATATRTVEVVEVSSRATRTISTPEAAIGFTFRVTVEIELGTSVNGLGMDEDLPPGFQITPVDNAGATFKRAETQWVWPSSLQANEIRRVVYDVTVNPEANIGELPSCFNVDGFIESASPAFLTDIQGQSKVCLVDCLSTPVAVSHLTPEGVVDLRLDNQITDDQLQRSVSFWMEEAGVPGTCNALIDWEMLKTLTAHQLDAIPVDQSLPTRSQRGATVTRTIHTPLPAFQVYLPSDEGRVFRVRLHIDVQRELRGFGLKETFPQNWSVRAINSDGAVFKKSTREWVFTERLDPQFTGSKTIVYEVTVPEGESTGFVRMQGKHQAIIPSFEFQDDGDREVELIECLSVPVAVAHLNADQNRIDVGMSNLIQFDQIQAAIAFWLEDVSVPGTCGKTVGFETIKALIAHWLTDTPVDQTLPGGVAVPDPNN